jgi:membrane-bound lytic murein transglycosylase D
MGRGGWLALTFGVIAAGCASRPPLRSTAPAVPTTSPTFDAGEYHKTLEDAYSEIVARETTPVDAPRVDVEAAASMPIPEHQSVRAALAYFVNDLKPSIQESLVRSGRYKKLIDRVLDEYKLPKGLAYLPIIESAYVPTLTSRAGAHGIWQFMPDTAREYGLRVDWWVDERADPELSTRAAAAYLTDLYRHFQDWPLALAAYNGGPGRIDRALASSGTRTFWDLFEDAAIPRETRGYVPTFFAALIIASDPSTYGFRLGDSIEEDVRSVEVDGPLSLRFLAESANVDEPTMRDLNPALHRGLLPPGRSILHLPSRAAESIASHGSALKNEDTGLALCSYTLREGDTIRQLARVIGSKVETILDMNALTSARSVGRGDSIYLPVRARELGSLLAETYYTVRKGDTMYSIAKRHDLTLDELRELNQFSRRHRIHTGDKIRVVSPRSLSAGGM